MDEHRRDDEQQFRSRESSSTTQRNDDQKDDLTRLRTQQERPSLTRREKEERWPIG